MRIALVIESFERGAGGAERDAVELAQAFSERDVSLSIVCRKASLAAPPGASLEIVGGPSFWQPLRVLVFSSRAGTATHDRFDVVHSYSRTRHQDIYRAGGGSHAEFMDRFYARPGLQRWSPRHGAILSIEEAVFRDERQIIQCLTERDATDIANRYGVSRERLVVTRTGVDVMRFSPQNREEFSGPLRRELGIEGPVALFVGSGFARKGLDRAIDGLAKSGAEASLLVAGAGDPRPYRQQAQRLGIAEQVRFLGVRADIERLHAVADLVVLPTRYDAFGNVVLEAMASGVPPATTPMAGASELIEDGRTGFVLEEDFTPAFLALADKERLKEMGRVAREVAQGYTWARHADVILDLYRKVAG
ncbi:MAG: glycosyltransferase family 4 protein [bacterium]|nr:glycosyltransferase family 4 protein [bacterium]